MRDFLKNYYEGRKNNLSKEEKQEMLEAAQWVKDNRHRYVQPVYEPSNLNRPLEYFDNQEVTRKGYMPDKHYSTFNDDDDDDYSYRDSDYVDNAHNKIYEAETENPYEEDEEMEEWG